MPKMDVVLKNSYMCLFVLLRASMASTAPMCIFTFFARANSVCFTCIRSNSMELSSTHLSVWAHLRAISQDNAEKLLTAEPLLTTADQQAKNMALLSLCDLIRLVIEMDYQSMYFKLSIIDATLR